MYITSYEHILLYPYGYISYSQLYYIFGVNTINIYERFRYIYFRTLISIFHKKIAVSLQANCYCNVPTGFKILYFKSIHSKFNF